MCEKSKTSKSDQIRKLTSSEKYKKESAKKEKFRAHFQPNQKRQIKLKTFDIKKIHFNSHVTFVTLWRSDRIRFGILTHTHTHTRTFKWDKKTHLTQKINCHVITISGVKPGQKKLISVADSLKLAIYSTEIGCSTAIDTR